MFVDANLRTINKVSLEVNYFARSTVLQFSVHYKPIALDFDPLEDRIYWSDIKLQFIARAFKNGTFPEILYHNEIHSPNGLAVDWIGRNIYWTDNVTGHISVGKLDGSSRKSLIDRKSVV